MASAFIIRGRLARQPGPNYRARALHSLALPLDKSDFARIRAALKRLRTTSPQGSLT